MICPFCNNVLSTDRASSHYFKRFICSAHDAEQLSYAQLYNSEDGTLLAEYIRIDEFFVSRIYFGKLRTNVFKAASTEDMQNFRPKVCEIPGIMNIPFHDLDLLKKKLQMCVIFS